MHPVAQEPDKPVAAKLSALSSEPVGHNDKDPFLLALGERTRARRARRGLTRKGLAKAADVSERHLANVEMGVGNASIQFLRQVAQALNCTLAELVGDETASSPEWLMIREILRGRSEPELAQARGSLAAMFGAPAGQGRMLAESRGVPFVELNRQIEGVAGCSLSEIHSLYGPQAYRRYERRALEDAIQRFPRAVIAMPGGIVSEPATFNLLLAQCYTVWVRATPEEHMSRVLAQGDTRPMNGNLEAMADLRRILDSRAAFYSKADEVCDTSDKTTEAAFARLREQLQASLGERLVAAQQAAKML
jgi:XRE family aerobic/anaerobic benzoate catabolism transcriptional regulator